MKLRKLLLLFGSLTFCLAAAPKAAPTRKRAPTACRAQGAEYLKRMKSLRQAFDDEKAVAGATARIALGERVSKLQELRRAMKALKAPDCMLGLVSVIDLAAQADVDALLSFMRQEETSATFSRDMAGQLWTMAREEERRIEMDLPVTPKSLTPTPNPELASTTPTPLPTQEPSSTEPFEVGDAVSAATLLYKEQPAYPEDARKAGKEGVVIVAVVISKEGNVGDAKILKSTDSSLDAAALDAVRRWKYQPATKDGRPVAVHLTITLSFNLTRREH